MQQHFHARGRVNSPFYIVSQPQNCNMGPLGLIGFGFTTVLLQVGVPPPPPPPPTHTHTHSHTHARTHTQDCRHVRTHARTHGFGFTTVLLQVLSPHPPPLFLLERAQQGAVEGGVRGELIQSALPPAAEDNSCSGSSDY